MDLGLDQPSLHEVLDLPNDEGVSDAFLYGASVQHIAKPALDDAIFFASAGTAAGDPDAVLGHPRWNDLAGGFSEADATLLLYLPCEIPGAGKILSRATDILFLSAQGESADVQLGPASIKVVANAGPLGSPPMEMGEPPAAPEAEEAAVGEAFDTLDMAEEIEDLVEAEEAELAAEEGGGGFDFGGGLELADGFGEVDLDEGPAEGEAVAAADDDASDLGGGLDLVEEGEEEAPHDLGIAADFSGELEAPAFGEEEERAEVGAPDFGADFVDMPDDEAGGFQPAPAEEEGEFGGDLVQGPDFGGPAPGAMVEEPVPGGVEALPAPDVPVSEEEAPPDIAERPRPTPKRRPPPKKKAPVGLFVGLAVVLGAVVAVGGTAFGFLNIPGLTVLQEYTGSVPDPALTLGGPQATEPVMQYSLVIFDDYREDDLDQAAGMVEALQLELPHFLFFLVPVDTEGGLIYHLLAGPALTPLEAEDIRTPLSAELPREDADLWEVRATPRAFYLGERETLAEARDYLAEVEAQGIDAYILQSTYEDGSEGFVIFSGGYEGVDDARRLQILLRRAGFGDRPLIERRGVFPG